MKNSNDTIGDQTRDLLTCSAAPQPTALPCAPLLFYSTNIKIVPTYFNSVQSVQPVLIKYILMFCLNLYGFHNSPFSNLGYHKIIQAMTGYLHINTRFCVH